MKVNEIPIKQNANQVTDPKTQVSAEEFNALVDNAKESVTSMEVLAEQEEVKLSYGKGKGTSSVLTFPTATAQAAGMMSPKQAARIADRTATDGMGYVVLNKDKSFAEQVTQENTIYEIRYDFDLGGATKEIPVGCVLKFEGGSLNNGTLNLSGSDIVSTGRCLSDIIVLGGNNKRFNLAWFGISSAGTQNSVLMNKLKHNDIRNYYLSESFEAESNDIQLPNYVTIDGNGHKIYFKSTTGSSCIILARRNKLKNIELQCSPEFAGNVLEVNTGKNLGVTIESFYLSNVTISSKWVEERQYKATGLLVTNTYKSTPSSELNGLSEQKRLYYITQSIAQNIRLVDLYKGIRIENHNIDGDTPGDFAWINSIYFNNPFISCNNVAIECTHTDEGIINPANSIGPLHFHNCEIQALNISKKIISKNIDLVFSGTLSIWDSGRDIGTIEGCVIRIQNLIPEVYNDTTEGDYDFISGFQCPKGKINVLRLDAPRNRVRINTGTDTRYALATNKTSGFIDSWTDGNDVFTALSDKYMSAKHSIQGQHYEGLLEVEHFRHNSYDKYTGEGNIVLRYRNKLSFYNGDVEIFTGLRNDKLLRVKLLYTNDYLKKDNKKRRMDLTIDLRYNDESYYGKFINNAFLIGCYSAHLNSGQPLISNVTLSRITSDNTIHIGFDFYDTEYSGAFFYILLECNNTVTFTSTKPMQSNEYSIDVLDAKDQMPTDIIMSLSSNYDIVGTVRCDSPHLGQQMFDSSIGKIILWNGTAWVDATGATV